MCIHQNKSVRGHSSMRIRTIKGATAMRALVVTLALFSGHVAHAQAIPTDAQPTCTISQTAFNAFFEGGNVVLNGVVNPANSVDFSNVPNCPFYQWSEQMFLWLTSPSPSRYGGSGRIFDSPVFYDVSPPDQTTGERTFIPHAPRFIRRFNLRAAQAGPSGLPVTFDKQGRLLQIAPPQAGPHGLPLIRNTAGDLVEIEKSSINAEKQPVFSD